MTTHKCLLMTKTGQWCTRFPFINKILNWIRSNTWRFVSPLLDLFLHLREWKVILKLPLCQQKQRNGWLPVLNNISSHTEVYVYICGIICVYAWACGCVCYIEHIQSYCAPTQIVSFLCVFVHNVYMHNSHVKQETVKVWRDLVSERRTHVNLCVFLTLLLVTHVVSNALQWLTFTSVCFWYAPRSEPEWIGGICTWVCV